MALLKEFRAPQEVNICTIFHKYAVILFSLFAYHEQLAYKGYFLHERSSIAILHYGYSTDRTVRDASNLASCL